MKFFKGMVVGAVLSTGVLLMMADGLNNKNIKRAGRRFVRKVEGLMSCCN